MPELTSRLIDITRRTLDVEGERITGATRFVEDLGLDSIDCVELMIAIEDAFGIEFPDEDLPELTTISAVGNYISRVVVPVGAARSLLSPRFEAVPGTRLPVLEFGSADLAAS